MNDSELKKYIKLLMILIILAIVLKLFGQNAKEDSLWNAIISFTITMLFMIHFEKFIEAKRTENTKQLESISSMLFSLIVFTLIEFIIDRNEDSFSILIIFIILFGITIYYIFKTENSKGP